MDMKLILTDDEGLVKNEWTINQDIDLPDLEELVDSLYEAGFYDEDIVNAWDKLKFTP